MYNKLQTNWLFSLEHKLEEEENSLGESITSLSVSLAWTEISLLAPVLIVVINDVIVQKMYKLN